MTMHSAPGAHLPAASGEPFEQAVVISPSSIAKPFGESNRAAGPPTRLQVSLLMLIGLIVLFARAPHLLLQGHVVAEEGTTYLLYAWDATPLRALLAPHQGYYSLLDNLCALIAARVLPLSATAIFFTWTAAAIQLLLLFLAVQCEAFRTPLQRWLALFALLLATPNFEIWLSLENCQWLLVVAAAVILISSTRRLFLLRSATLALGALSGVTTVPLIPLFWLKAWRQRSRRAVVFALSITLPAFLQSAILLRAMSAGDRPVSTHEIRALVAYTSSRVLVLPFTTGRGALYYDTFLFHHPGIVWRLTLYIASAILLVLGFLLFRTSRAALLLYVSALLSCAFDWYGCFHCTFDLILASPGGEGRYFFPANAILLLALLLSATSASGRWLARASFVAFAWLLVTGTFQYFRMRPIFTGYPAWLPQVRRWEVDEHQPIIIAPDFWRTNPLHLPHRHPNLADLPANADDPASGHQIRD
jgi:hypothetical protein